VSVEPRSQPATATTTQTPQQNTSGSGDNQNQNNIRKHYLSIKTRRERRTSSVEKSHEENHNLIQLLDHLMVCKLLCRLLSVFGGIVFKEGNCKGMPMSSINKNIMKETELFTKRTFVNDLKISRLKTQAKPLAGF